MNEKVCLSCGKEADVTIDTVVHPITARGERACEKVGNVNTVHSCVGCLIKIGTAINDGKFNEEEEP